MRKIFKFVAIAVVAASALTLASCKKSDDPKDKEEDKTPTYRMISYANVGEDWEDRWVFSYNQDGTLAEANRGDDKHDWLFTYSGKNVTVKLKTGETVFEMVLDDNGNAVKFSNKEKQEESVFEYDKAGFLVKATVNGVEKTLVTVQNDCITNWTRINTKEGVEGPWRYKDHTYDPSKKNLGGVHTSYSEDTGVSRWIHEAGFLGKASAFVCEDAQWRDSDKKATYEYEYDANGCIVKEIKYYDKALDATYAFTYEEIKK